MSLTRPLALATLGVVLVGTRPAPATTEVRLRTGDTAAMIVERLWDALPLSRRYIDGEVIRVIGPREPICFYLPGGGHDQALAEQFELVIYGHRAPGTRAAVDVRNNPMVISYVDHDNHGSKRSQLHSRVQSQLREVYADACENELTPWG